MLTGVDARRGVVNRSDKPGIAKAVYPDEMKRKTRINAGLWDQLEIVRREEKLTWGSLALRVGLSRATFYTSRDRKSQPSDTSVAKLAAAFNLRVQWLLEGTGEKHARKAGAREMAIASANALGADTAIIAARARASDTEPARTFDQWLPSLTRYGHRSTVYGQVVDDPASEHNRDPARRCSRVTQR